MSARDLDRNSSARYAVRTDLIARCDREAAALAAASPSAPPEDGPDAQPAAP